MTILPAKALTIACWAAPAVAAAGAVAGVIVHLAFPEGHPPLSAYVFGPSVLLALALSPFGIAAGIARLRAGRAGANARLGTWMATLLNTAILLGCAAVWLRG